MTVLGQKHHYNVKLLKGYDMSIILKDNRVCPKAGRDPFTRKQEKEEWFVIQIPYERIAISGKATYQQKLSNSLQSTISTSF
jgi:CRISPR-associated protein Cas1